jgi:nucleoside-diphosphate-sugar epimerase
MTKIALAGGTGDVGRTLVDAFKANGKHEIVILSRKARPDLEQKLSVKTIAVDYHDVDALAQVLHDNGIEAIISTLSSLTITDGAGPELNLIAATARTPSVTRFIPSVWGIPYPPEYIDRWPPAKSNKLSMEALSKSDLEWTAIYLGYFLDYFMLPKVPTHLAPFPMLIDAENNRAAIPAEGNNRITLSRSEDVAKFVVAMFDLPKWDNATYIVGDTLSLIDFVKILEDVKGVRFNVAQDSIRDLEQGKITELPCYDQLYANIPKEVMNGLLAVFALFASKGALDLSGKPAANASFPGISMMSVKNGIQEAWGKTNEQAQSEV